jgi:hypothetical protein
MMRLRAALAAIAMAGCAPATLSPAGARVQVVTAPEPGCARVAELNASAGYNGRDTDANAAGVLAELRNAAALKSADAIVVRARVVGAPPVDPHMHPDGAQGGGCPNCVAMRADAYQCAKKPSAEQTAAAARRFAVVAGAALAAVAEHAGPCLPAGSPPIEAHLRVTFAPTGDVVYADVEGAPLEGTAAGNCVVAKANRAHVPPFEGSPRSVAKTLTIKP